MKAALVIMAIACLLVTGGCDDDDDAVAVHTTIPQDEAPPMVPAPGAVLLVGFGTILVGLARRRHIR